MPGWCCRSRPAFHRGPRLFWWPRCSTSAQCCSAAAAWSGNCFPAGILKRKPMWRVLSWRMVVVALSMAAAPSHAQAPIKVVASFSILGDFVRQIGGDRVNLTTLVGPNGDVHVYTPAPADAKTIADARLVFVNGLGLEGWLPRLLQASGDKAQIVTATAGIAPLRADTEADPHAWQSVSNAKIYAANIRDALVQADPADAPFFRNNAARYLTELDALDR